MKHLPTLAAAAAVVLAALLAAAPAQASPYRVTIDTTALQGVAGGIAFDFVAGSPATGNQARVSNVAFDGSFGLSQSTGSISGSLQPGPLTLGGTQFFSEWLQFVTAFGNSIVFDLDLGDAVSAGGRADQFAFFLLDTGQLPFPTTDPSGAGALFYFDLAGAATAPVIYTSNFAIARIEGTTPPTGMPEPASLLLAMTACVAAVTARARQRA